jgi:hypothetical protein
MFGFGTGVLIIAAAPVGGIEQGLDEYLTTTYVLTPRHELGVMGSAS